MLLKRCLLVGRRKQVGKDMADTMGLGTGEDMMVGGGGGGSFLAPIHSSRSKSTSLGDVEGPFGTSVKGQRDMKPGPVMEGKPVAVQICTALVREMPETAAVVALFSHLLTVTSVNRVVEYIYFGCLLNFITSLSIN